MKMHNCGPYGDKFGGDIQDWWGALKRCDVMIGVTKNLWRLVPGLRDVAEASVREIGIGYVIRSNRAGWREVLLARLASFAPVFFWSGAAAVWLGLSTGLLLNAAYGVAIVALALLAIALFSRPGCGTELVVDLSRRELRLAAVSGGTARVRRRARFGEVLGLVLRRAQPGVSEHSLSLRIAGQSVPLTIATGDVAVLSAILDRVTRDLRPIEERLACSILKPRASRIVEHPVFAALRSESVAA